MKVEAQYQDPLKRRVFICYLFDSIKQIYLVFNPPLNTSMLVGIVQKALQS